MDEYAIDFGLKYVNSCIASDEKPTLSGMIGYIDAYERVIASLDEINEILQQHPKIFIKHDSGRAELVTGTGDVTITEDERMLAYAEYKKSFDAE